MADERDAIERLAYQRFQDRGAMHGHDLDDWLAAEAELRQPQSADAGRSAAADGEMAPVALPGDEEASEIRAANERDQRLEREGRSSRRNRGYDAAAKGLTPSATPDR